MRAIACLLLFLGLSACDSAEDRRPGVCYCEFYSGDEQEYDYSDLTRDEQVAECNQTDQNAANFGGRCELE